ncbi:porin [Gemmatimonadota bacterium]
MEIIERLAFRHGAGCALLVSLLFLPTPIAAQVEISARASRMTIGGRVHTQFVHSSVEGDKSSDFFLSRARLVFELSLNDFVEGRLEHDFVVGLRDAFLRLNFDPAFRVSAGQFKRAFDLFELYSTTQLQTIERAGGIPGLAVCPGVGGICSLSQFRLEYSARDIGVRVDGVLGEASYLATLTNGTGSNSGDENGAKSFAGRLVYPLMDGVRLGANVSVHDYPSSGGADELATAYGGDVEIGEYLKEGVHLQAGIIAGDNWKAGEEVRFVTAQAVLMDYIAVDWWPGRVTAVEPMARVSWGDPQNDIDEDGGTLLTPGIAVYFTDRTRLGANLDVYLPQEGDREYSLKVQAYIWF